MGVGGRSMIGISFSELMGTFNLVFGKEDELIVQTQSVQHVFHDG